MVANTGTYVPLISAIQAPHLVAGYLGLVLTCAFFAAQSDRFLTGGNLSLMDYCTAGPQFASGGFIADSRLPSVVNGSQQQWLTRNSELGSWSNGVWNQVFAGVEGAPSEADFPNPPYTTLEPTPVSREKPYLFGEDFSFYNRIAPSYFIFFGSRNEEKGFTSSLHTSTFDFDEAVLVKVADYYEALMEEL